MADVSPAVRALAEDLNLHIPLGEGAERIVRPGWALWLGTGDHPAFTVVQRLRLDAEADAVEVAVAEVRGLLRERGRRAATWEIGSSARPDDLEARLLALGMRPFDEPDVVGMALTEPLAETVHDVRTTRVTTLAEMRAAMRIFDAGFGTQLRDEAAVAASYADHVASSTRVVLLAWIGDEPVAAASLTYADAAAVLGGAVTLEHARGRGAFRALVAARVALARARGLDGVVVQAGAMSRPILARLGFVEVCAIRILVDDR